MSGLAKIDLSSYREDIASGADSDRNGTRIQACPRGSVGRAIQDARKSEICPEKRISNREEQRTAFPLARTKKAIEQYARLGIKNIRDEGEMYDDAEIRSRSTTSRMDLLVSDPVRFFRSESVNLVGSDRAFKTMSSFAKREDSPFYYFLERVQRKLLEKYGSASSFVTRAMKRYSESENVLRMIQESGAKEIVDHEARKSNTYLDTIFISVFDQVSEQKVDKYHHLVKIALDLGRLDEEDMRISNPYGFELPVIPIRPGSGRSLDPRDQKQLEDEIVNESNHHLVSILRKKLEQVQIHKEQIRIDRERQRPEGGFGKTIFRQNERTKDRVRVATKKLQEGQDPKTLFDFDPDSLRYEDQSVWMTQPHRDYMLPKRARDDIYRKMGKVPL